ncbi:hypothetical protein ACFL4K_01770 [Candidatus Neomarinimicrobiota bacterium]
MLESFHPINYNDLIDGKKYLGAFNESFYLGFLATVFEFAPFEGYLGIGSSINIENELKKRASSPNTLSLWQLFKGMTHSERLHYLKAIFSSKNLTIKKDNDGYWINRTKYGQCCVLHQCLRENDRPTSLDEFCKFLRESPYYRSEVRPRCVYNTLTINPEFIIVDWHVWGFKKHLSYDESSYPSIQAACRDIIHASDVQLDASILFKRIKSQFQALRSKYELVYILRQDPSFRDLGFYTFILDESDQEERVKISDIVRDIFSGDQSPLSVEEIYQRVSKVRSASRSGFNTGLKKMDFLEHYVPFYFGLKSCRNANLSFLSSNHEFHRGL